MNSKYKRLTLELSTILQEKSFNFIIKTLKDNGDSQETGDLIDLVLSAHLSSLYNLMRMLSRDNPEVTEKVNNFINELSSFISKTEPIEKVEVI